jgi:DNA-binding transcriptional MerR regulator
MQAMPPLDRRARSLEKRAAKKAAVNRLKEAIATFQERGYTLEQIARFLSNPGPPSSTPRLDDRSSVTRRQRRDVMPVDEVSTLHGGDGDDGDPFGSPHET